MTITDKTIQFTRPNIQAVVNKTTLFMLPAVNLNSERTGYRMLEYFGLVNCYISHNQSLEGNSNSVYMVFNPSKDAMKDFRRLYDVYKGYSNFVGDYQVDFNLIVVVFDVKDRWRSTYSAFKESKYSKMSKEYAELFKNSGTSGKNSATTQYFIIHKHKSYREYLEKELGLDDHIAESAELMDALDMQKEIFDYELNTGEKLLALQPGKGECQVGEITGDSIYIQPS